MNYKKQWETLRKIYGDKELKPFTICRDPNKEYPITVNDLKIKTCMDYVENIFLGGKNHNERQKTNSSMP